MLQGCTSLVWRHACRIFFFLYITINMTVWWEYRRSTKRAELVSFLDILARHMCTVNDSDSLDPLKWAKSLTGQIFEKLEAAEAIEHVLKIAGHENRDEWLTWFGELERKKKKNGRNMKNGTTKDGTKETSMQEAVDVEDCPICTDALPKLGIEFTRLTCCG